MAPNPLLSVGVVGATGIVGQEFIKILEEKKFPAQELRLFGGQKSEGSQMNFRGKALPVMALGEGCFKGLDVVFFSAGNPVSKEWAPRAVRERAFAIDNSSAFRMSPEVPLIVPEVNRSLIPAATQPCLIANPNCSTIQLVTVLFPLAEAFGLNDVRVSSYQSVSGAGRDGIEELKTQSKQILNGPSSPTDVAPKFFPHPIAFNNIPQIGAFDDNGFSEEENKIINETRKILNLHSLRISCFAVRTPTLNGHSEAVWVTFNKATTYEDILAVLRPAGGIEIQDDTSSNGYPMTITSSGKDPVFVGRIRQDPMDPKTWLFWIVADNLRKGAALNGVQIAEEIFDLNR